MRIVSGDFRGKALITPAGDNTRPTSDRARQAIFNILEHAPWSEGVREQLLIEEEGQRRYLGFTGRVRMRSLINGRYRLSVYDGVPWGELYDLREDPDELVNLWEDARLRGALCEELARAMLEHSETSPYPTQIA